MSLFVFFGVIHVSEIPEAFKVFEFIVVYAKAKIWNGIHQVVRRYNFL